MAVEATFQVETSRSCCSRPATRHSSLRAASPTVAPADHQRLGLNHRDVLFAFLIGNNDAAGLNGSRNHAIRGKHDLRAASRCRCRRGPAPDVLPLARLATNQQHREVLVLFGEDRGMAIAYFPTNTNNGILPVEGRLPSRATVWWSGFFVKYSNVLEL